MCSGVEGGIGNLVRFIEDVDLEAVARRTVAGPLAQLANFVDAAVGGRVNLNNINRVAGTDFRARIAYATGFRHRLIRGTAIQRHGQNPSHGGLADATMSAEDVPVSAASLGDGVLESTGDVLLSDDLGELLRTVLTRQDGVAHESEMTIIRDQWESLRD